MTGAAILAGRAALKTGAGKVMLGIAQTPMPVAYDSAHPELMLHAAQALLAMADKMDAWAAGCGLGHSDYACQLLRQLFIHRKDIPLVLDADGLNAVASGEISATWGRGDIVLTPHPAEAARLLQTETQKIQRDRSAAAMALAKNTKPGSSSKAPAPSSAPPIYPGKSIPQAMSVWQRQAQGMCSAVFWSVCLPKDYPCKRLSLQGCGCTVPLRICWYNRESALSA